MSMFTFSLDLRRHEYPAFEMSWETSQPLRYREVDRKKRVSERPLLAPAPLAIAPDIYLAVITPNDTRRPCLDGGKTLVRFFPSLKSLG